MAKSKQKVDPDDKIIAEIKAYIRANPPPPEGAPRPDPREQRGPQIRMLFPVASKRAIAKAEAAIGYEIPGLLKRFYLEVGNGIYASGSIVGVEGGCEAGAGTLVPVYLDHKAGYEYDGELDKWDPNILPFCDWGCAMYSCVDCSDPSFPISTWEDCELWPEDYTLRDFFNAGSRARGGATRRSRSCQRRLRIPLRGRRRRFMGRRDAGRNEHDLFVAAARPACSALN